jgi:hypothetical protein
MFLRSVCRGLPLFAEGFLLLLFCLKMGVQWEGRSQTAGAKFYERLSMLEEHKTSTLNGESKGHTRTGHEDPEGE